MSAVVGSSQIERDREILTAAEWCEYLSPRLKSEYAAEYAAALETRQVRSNQGDMADEDLAEMGIRIGHRRTVLDVLREVADLSKRGRLEKITSISNIGVVTSAIDTENVPNGMRCTTTVLRDGTQWNDIEGSAPSLQEFVDHISMEVLRCGSVMIPKAKGLFPRAFLRAFRGQKPMPYTDHGYASGGRCVMIVLRLPKTDSVRERATKVRSLTDLFVLLLRFEGSSSGEVVHITTVHRRPASSFVGLETLMSRVRDMRVPRWLSLVEELLYFCLGESPPALESIRQKIEALVGLRLSHQPQRTVEEFLLRGRQAQALRRSLNANIRALRIFESVFLGGTDDATDPSGAIFTRTTARAEETLQLAEELEALAMQTMNLRMALIDFRFQSNLRLFAYMSIVLQPLTLMTGWYGMNWKPFPEFSNPDAYYIFAGVAGGVAILLVALIAWFTHDAETHAAADDDDGPAEDPPASPAAIADAPERAAA